MFDRPMRNKSLNQLMTEAEDIVKQIEHLRMKLKATNLLIERAEDDERTSRSGVHDKI